MRTFPKLVALSLIGLFLSFSFNAYACLVPVYGSKKVSQGSDCTKPAEKSASQFCEGFKTLAVHSSTDIPSGALSHVVVAGNTPFLIPVPVKTSQFLPLFARGYLPPSEDILVLISVFRI